MVRLLVGRALGALAVAVLCSCGGGSGSDSTPVVQAQAPTVQATSATLPPPSSGIVTPDECNASALAAGEVQQTDGGCVRSNPAMRLPLSAAALGGPAAALTADQLMDWAEGRYPQFFRGAGRTQGYSVPYTYRYYPETGNYLGVSTGSSDVAIYVLGPVSNWQIHRVGSLRDYTCTVLPNSCVVAVSPASLQLQAPEGGSQKADLVVTLPALNAGSISVQADSGWQYGQWLSATVVDRYTIRVTASAGDGAASSSRQGTLWVTHVPQGGGSATSTTIPVTLSVVPGLVAPPNQTKTLDADATAAALSGSVPIQRGDNVEGSWTATSSAPWLVLPDATGTTPGTLRYAVDMTAAAGLANFTDHTATVTVTAAGIKPVSFTVVLRKRIPYVAAAMPYGIPAGRTSRVMVGGGGFSSVGDIAKALKVSGATVSNVTRVSDTLLSFDFTPPAAGKYEVTLGSGAQATPVAVHVASADPYAASSVSLNGDDMVRIYLQDPVRRAIFGLSPMGNALYKYQFAQGQWTVSALPMTDPYNFALTPDGRRLLVVTKSAIKTVDPDSLKVTASQVLSIAPSYPYLSPLAVTVDGRLWIPSYRPSYFDLIDNTVKQANAANDVVSDSYYASGDGSMVLIAPGYSYSPRGPWHVYKVADASVTKPMGETDPWYDIGVSANGTRAMSQSYGQVWDEHWDLVGQLPEPSESAQFLSRLALSPDGTRIVALATKDSSVLRIDVFDTTRYVSGSTRFQKIGSITPASPSADCGPQGIYGCTMYGQLIVSHDNQWVFWLGNKKVQAFRMP
jgi:hypothetical protein